jgi:two-component system, OmpR family, alkaline phosphatase synthesis response regulator PhoP
MRQPILIVEDEQDISESLKFNLEREGFAVITAFSGEQAIGYALDSQRPPRLILVDLMLPGMSGLDLCRRLRREPLTRRTPIIILTAKTAEADRVTGLDIGADDYISKPFSVRELIARVKALLRRTEEESSQYYEDAQLRIDFEDIRVICNGKNVKLTNKEFNLLAILAKSADRVITRQQLLDRVWGYSYYGDTRTLDVHIRRLRQKLVECGDCIETVVGVGYRFVGCTGSESDRISL